MAEKSFLSGGSELCPCFARADTIVLRFTHRPSHVPTELVGVRGHSTENRSSSSYDLYVLALLLCCLRFGWVVGLGRVPRNEGPNPQIHKQIHPLTPLIYVHL